MIYNFITGIYNIAVVIQQLPKFHVFSVLKIVSKYQTFINNLLIFPYLYT